MIPVISKKGGEMLARNRKLPHKPPPKETLEDHLHEMFEQEMREVLEDYPNLTHGAVTMTAAERVVEIVQERVHRIADNRKWGHIEEVNKAHYGG